MVFRYKIFLNLSFSYGIIDFFFVINSYMVFVNLKLRNRFCYLNSDLMVLPLDHAKICFLVLIK